MSAEVPPPSWVLISVLFSSFQLEQDLAHALHRVARDLYRREVSHGPVEHGAVKGTVRNLENDVALGSITGPTFEAELDLEQGEGRVRFILTRQGLDLMARRDEELAALRAPKYLN